MFLLELAIVFLLTILLLDKLGVGIFRFLFLCICVAYGITWAVLHPRQFKQKLKECVEEHEKRKSLRDGVAESNSQSLERKL